MTITQQEKNEMHNLFAEKVLKDKTVAESLRMFGDGKLGQLVLRLMEKSFAAGVVCALKQAGVIPGDSSAKETKDEQSCQKS